MKDIFNSVHGFEGIFLVYNLERSIISGFQGFFHLFLRIKKNSEQENSPSNKTCLLENAIKYHTCKHLSCISINVISNKSESRYARSSQKPIKPKTESRMLPCRRTDYCSEQYLKDTILFLKKKRILPTHTIQCNHPSEDLLYILHTHNLQPIHDYWLRV